MRFGVWGSWLELEAWGFRVWGLGVGAWGVGFGVWGVGFCVYGLKLLKFQHSAGFVQGATAELDVLGVVRACEGFKSYAGLRFRV